MISAYTLQKLESDKHQILYILGARKRRVKEIRDQVLSHPGRYTEVRPEPMSSKDPSELKVKEVQCNGHRYIVCVNSRQSRKEAKEREAIIASFKEQLKKGAKSIVGNKGYRKYLRIEKDAVRIDDAKIKSEARFDGKWVLRTNTDLTADQVAPKTLRCLLVH